MLTNSIRDHFLVDELQLGEQLNVSLQQGESAHFALLLSMLSDDLLDSPVFSQTKTSDVQQSETNKLRKFFSIGPPLPLDGKEALEEETEFRSQLLHEGGISAVRLYGAIQPEPLVCHQYELVSEVWNDLPPLKQAKIKEQLQLKHQPLEADSTMTMLSVLEDFNYERELSVQYF